MQFDNRITRLLGVEVPIVQAPGLDCALAVGGSETTYGALALLKPHQASWM